MQVLIEQIVKITPVSSQPLVPLMEMIMQAGGYSEEQMAVDDNAGCVVLTLSYESEV